MSDEIYETEELVNELVGEIKRLEEKNVELSRTAGNISSKGKDVNLITAQLEAEELLKKLERFYKGMYLKREGDHTFWTPHENKDLIPLNDYGVNLLMEVVTKYIDKNTILSRYNEERIYEILADIGDELNLIIFCNYEKMGMDTYHKKTKYRIIVTTTLHLIESTYRRSIDGKTSEEVNQSRIVSQSESLGRMPQQINQKKKWSLLDPRTWGG